MRCVSRLPPLGQALIEHLASHSSWVVPQVMPGCAVCEGDTRRSARLVAESEPGETGIPGGPDIRLRSEPAVLVFSYRPVGSPRVLEADRALDHGAAAGRAALRGRHAR